tara:strand:+ start:482 stop:724 length:243 start_codon:yes stop_codon:yes gene_type:complete
MNNNTHLLLEKLSNTENTLTTLEIISGVLGVLFVSSEIIGKSKCKANSVLGWIASWFNNVSKCNTENEKEIELTEIKTNK